MKLSIENVGKVKSASINLEGITLIAGENDTGKSTLSKALFSIFRSCENISKSVLDERINHIIKSILGKHYNPSVKQWMLNSYNNHEVAYDFIFKNCDAYKLLGELDFLDLDNERKKSIADKINKVNDYTDDDIAIGLINDCFRKEFSNNINNIITGDDSIINICIKNDEYSFTFRNNQLQKPTNYPKLYKHVVYIDDPLSLDTMSEPIFNLEDKVVNHRLALAQDVYANVNNDTIENMVTNDLMKELNHIVSGNMNVPKNVFNSLEYQLDSQHSLDLSNVSAGLKNFILLKHLISLGKIEENGLLILDEPEIHLHPKLQVELAEIVVKLYVKFGIHILVTSHSNYFIDALQTYSEQSGVSNKLNLYLSKGKDLSTLEDVTNKSEKIYETLFEPLKKLEEIDNAD